MSTINKDFLNCKRIAIYGISKTETKFGNSIYRELKPVVIQSFQCILI